MVRALDYGTRRAWLRGCSAVLMMAVVLSAAGAHARAQANSIPSAQTATDDGTGNRGRKLLDQMVTALGGEAWLQHNTWTEYGEGSTFYKGSANPFVFEFEEYHRAEPFGVRTVIVSHNANGITELIGVPISKAKRDVQTVWTPENGYEVTFKGRKELPKDDEVDYERRRRHTLAVLVNDWLKRPGTLVTFEGENMYNRRIADTVTVLTEDNDAITVRLDATTHLPISRSFQWRDATYKDFDTDEEQYNNWQPEDGILTPLTITRMRNGDIVSQRYLTKVVYNAQLAPDVFNPDRPLEKK